ncbi:MAG: class I SAM-dependent methyltransferase [Gemmatimonadetes bacterium]|nr:class I SAM-dependent methyltransferase [Gemmatimonadota bacterium]
MAIEPTYLCILRAAFRAVLPPRGNRKALGLGYPDLLIPDDQIDVEGIPIRPDSDAVLRWHGMTGHLPHVRDSVAWFAQMGFTLDCIDAHPTRDCERKVDLNEPLPGGMVGAYDLVVDTGTLEHCFNVGSAFRNAWAALKVGGVFCHAAPMTKINHGFWSFNPTVYPDFFEDNGGDIIVLKAATGAVLGHPEFHDVPHHQRFRCPDNLGLYVVARKREDVPFRWPTQRKYRNSGGAI